MTFTPEQIAERRLGVGSSEVAALFGFGYADQTPLSLWFEKTGQIDHSLDESEHLFWGKTLEEPIADVWAERHRMKIRRQPVMRWMKDKPLFASLDRQIIGAARGPGVLECKNFSYWTGRAIETLEDIPPSVRIQAMHELAVYGYGWGAIAILIGGNKLVSWEFERDQEAIDQIVATCEAFMETVKTRTPPPVDAKSASILAEAYARADGAHMTSVDPSILKQAQELVSWKAKKKLAESEWELRRNFIKLVMGNAAELEIPTFGKFTWKQTKSKTVRVFNEAEFKKAEPELYEKYVIKKTEPGHRVFRDSADEGDD
jgi:Phage-related protein, predicted endonuclease